MSRYHKLALVCMAILALIAAAGRGPVSARPSIRGGSAVIVSPSAYTSTSAAYYTRTRSGRSEVFTEMSAEVGGGLELSVNYNEARGYDGSLKLQLSKDTTSRRTNTPALAVGIQNAAGKSGAPRIGYVATSKMGPGGSVFHLGIVSKDVVFTNARFYAGMELPVSARMILLGETDPVEGRTNTGVEYFVAPNLRTFAYRLGPGRYESDEKEVVTGVCFRGSF